MIFYLKTHWMNKNEYKIIRKTNVPPILIPKRTEAHKKYVRPIKLDVYKISFNALSNWLPEANILEQALKGKWSCALWTAAYRLPIIHSWRKIWSKKCRIRKYKRWFKIYEATDASTLKVNLGYIVYDYTQDPNNSLQSYWNMYTKDYLGESVTLLIS